MFGNNYYSTRADRRVFLEERILYSLLEKQYFILLLPRLPLPRSRARAPVPISRMGNTDASGWPPRQRVRTVDRAQIRVPARPAAAAPVGE